MMTSKPRFLKHLYSSPASRSVPLRTFMPVEVVYFRICRLHAIKMSKTELGRTTSSKECVKKNGCHTCFFIKVFVVDDDALSHSLVAHLILECWWNNSVMAFRRVVLLPRLAILFLLTNRIREKKRIRGKLPHFFKPLSLNEKEKKALGLQQSTGLYILKCKW